jgi:ribosome-interacting GTPase 1
MAADCVIQIFNVPGLIRSACDLLNRVKKVVTVAVIPEQVLLFALSFVLSKLDLFTAQQQKQVKAFRSWNK